jgi:hypothetical protein
MGMQQDAAEAVDPADQAAAEQAGAAAAPDAEGHRKLLEAGQESTAWIRVRWIDSVVLRVDSIGHHIWGECLLQ